MTQRILLTGKTGQVGSELLRLLPKLGEVIAPGRSELDLVWKPDEIRRVVREVKPDLIVNAAAYTAVDNAEKNQATSHAVNTAAPRVLAEEAKKLNATLVHYSTDYVFDGAKTTAYVEDDLKGPLGVYGQTKWAGELMVGSSGANHIILRTAWVYAQTGRNFLMTILRLAAEREELRIVNDQIGAPTAARDIASATVRILEAGTAELERKSGTYNLTAGGETSWHGFATAILEETRRAPRDTPWIASAMGGRELVAKRVVPITTAEYPTPARRPAYSVLSNEKVNRAFGIVLPDWRESLRNTFRTEEEGVAR